MKRLKTADLTIMFLSCLVEGSFEEIWSGRMEAARSQLGKLAFYRYEVYSVARMEMKSDSLRVRGR
jgi:hypothetical protein